MRQAGRSLPRYRDLRAKHAMLDLVRDPESAAAITVMPLDYFPVDAAVLYNDLVTPFLAAGIDVELRPGVGPFVPEPILTGADIARLQRFDPRNALDFNLEAIRIARARIDVPVIGFIGAPLTLCSYLVGTSRTRELAGLKSFFWRDPEAWHRLAVFWAEHLADFAVAQHEAGAAAVQVFDSWAGSLSLRDYTTFALPYSRRIFEHLRDARVPSIHLAIGNPALLPLVASAGADAVSVDWRIPLDEAWHAIGQDRAIQGNLDPAAMVAGEDVAVRETERVLEAAAGRPGHIFNLGHGMPADADPEVARRVVEFVHSYTALPSAAVRGR